MAKAKAKAKDPLRKRAKAHQRYYTSDGNRVPGATTITGQLAKPALIHWAWKLGMDGIDYKVYRDSSADVGTLAHAMVVAHLGGPAVDMTQYDAQIVDMAENALIKFWDWEARNPIKPVLLEEQLVSDKHCYGGTLDCYAEMVADGKLWLIDFKTGKGIYPEMILQLASYRNLLMEAGHKVDGTRILRIGRNEDEGFEERIYTAKDLNKAFKAFCALCKYYHINKEIGRG